MSLLLPEGVPLQVVSEVVGHASIRLTKDPDGHLDQGQRAVAAGAMDQLFHAGQPRAAAVGPRVGPQARSRPGTGGSSSALTWMFRTPPGTRTQNLRIKSPTL